MNAKLRARRMLCHYQASLRIPPGKDFEFNRDFSPVDVSADASQKSYRVTNTFEFTW